MSNVRRLTRIIEMPSTSTVLIRPFVVADYESAVKLWSEIEGLGLNESDTHEAIEAFLERNPNFSAVAEVEGVIVGTVLCGHNGRAGSLNHLAVSETQRNRGIGQSLVNYSFTKLAEAKIPRCNIFVYTENEVGNRFWLRSGESAP